MLGIESVAVNIIGRYIVVKHCTVSCCAPSEKIAEVLNAKHLGVSMQEVAEQSDEQELLSRFDCLFCLLLWLCFLAGLVASLLHRLDVSTPIYLVGTCIGMLPVLKAAALSLLRKTIGIHVLIVLAVAGAVASEEYFDASLVVTLFVSSELLEAAIMLHVRNVVSSQAPKMASSATLATGKSISLRDLKVGDVISVRAGSSRHALYTMMMRCDVMRCGGVGEVVLADGDVVSGEGKPCDLSMSLSLSLSVTQSSLHVAQAWWTRVL